MSGSGLSTGLIAAIVAVLVGVLLVLLFVFLFFRRKHIQRKRSRMPLQSPTTPTLPIQDPDYLEAGFAGIKGPPSENPFADPEKPVFDASAGYLSRSTSVRSYAHLDMPQTPRTGHLRDSYYGGQVDGEGDDLQVRSNKASSARVLIDGLRSYWLMFCLMHQTSGQTSHCVPHVHPRCACPERGSIGAWIGISLIYLSLSMLHAMFCSSQLHSRLRYHWSVLPRPVIEFLVAAIVSVRSDLSVATRDKSRYEGVRRVINEEIG